MFNKLAIQSLVASAVLGLALAFSTGPAIGGPETCDPSKDKKCGVICHNIGGPRDLGANCDGTGVCTYNLGSGDIVVAKDHFLGIIIGFNQDSAGALAAHLAHGDGFVLLEFDPPLHLASTIGPHRASNVECLAKRAITTQPPEPGN